MRDAGRFFVLEPMGGVRKGEEFALRAVAKAFGGHFLEEVGVAFAPEDAYGDAEDFVREFEAKAESGTIPIDHGSESAGLRPCRAILRQVLLGKSTWTAGLDDGANADGEI